MQKVLKLAISFFNILTLMLLLGCVTSFRESYPYQDSLSIAREVKMGKRGSLPGKQDVEMITEKSAPKVQIFKGEVFSVTGNDATIVSSELHKLRDGQQVVFIDNAGFETGQGVVKNMFHTNAIIRIISGNIVKGMNVARFK